MSHRARQFPSAVRRHTFSPDILRRVRSCREKDNWHGILELTIHWAVIGASAWASLWAWRNLPIGLAVPTYVFAAFLIGGRQRALAGVLHQAVHGALMRSTTAGRVSGALFAAYPLLQSFTGYRSSHVTYHHGRFGHAELDPDYEQYRRYQICGENLTRPALRRHLRSILHPRTTGSYIVYLLRDRVLNKDEHPWERRARVGLIALAAVLIAALGHAPVVAAYWFVPLVTTQVWIGAVIELVEHYPLIESAPRVNIYMSRNRECGRLSDLLLGETYGEGYHLVHHLFPEVPIWRLADVHRILQRDAAYAALPAPPGWRALFVDLFSSLPPTAEPERGT